MGLSNSNRKTHHGGVRKHHLLHMSVAGKPSAEVRSSVLHQYEKKLARELKNLKIVAMLKMGKKIQALSSELAEYVTTDSEVSSTAQSVDDDSNSSSTDDSTRLKRMKIAAKLSAEERLRAALRSLDHSKMARIIIARRCSTITDISNSSTSTKDPSLKQQQKQQQQQQKQPADSRLSADEEELYQQFASNKKVADVLSEIDQKMAKAIEKNSKLRRLEQRKAVLLKKKQEKKSQQLSLIDDSVKPMYKSKSSRVALIRDNKSLFMDSLADVGNSSSSGSNGNSSNSSSTSDEARNEVKRLKSLRNQQNRVANKQKNKEGASNNQNNQHHYQQQQQQGNNNRKRKDGQDLSTYMPSGKRNSSGGNSNNSSSSRFSKSTSTAATVSATPAAVVKSSDAHALTKAAASGKEWQTTSGVHPSWAAKQKAKLNIPSAATVGAATGAVPQSKKIFFED